MILGVVLLIVIGIVYLGYLLYFKEYKEVMANFQTLVKVLETRDLLLMRILPDIKDKKIDNIDMDILSMGMTGDYEDAIEAGSSYIRVGRGIFGPRN